MNGLDKLEENIEALLLAELAALLHDDRKHTDYHIDKSVSGAPSPLCTQKDANDLIPSSLQITLLTNGETIFSGKFLDVKNRNKKKFNEYLNRCHYTAHIDKQEATDIKQQYPAYISSPFGFEGPNYQIPGNLTNDLRSIIPWNKLSVSPFKNERNELRREIELLFSRVGGDTRRPANEITLWEWSYIVSALFKSALAGSVLGFKPTDKDNLCWRLLSVRFDGFDFFGKTNRISDLLARRNLLEQALDSVKSLLEIDYPLGTEIYRDENGIIFVVPGYAQKETPLGKLRLLTVGDKTLEELIYGKFEIVIEKEIVPKIKIDDYPWYGQDPCRRGNDILPPIADHLKPTQTFVDHNWVKKQWLEGISEDICIVCGVFPQGHGSQQSGTQDLEKHRNEKHKTGEKPSECQVCKAQSRSVCQVCEKRRDDRSLKWAQARNKTDANQKPWQRTIWIDETADNNGRLSLIVGKFDLSEWITGNFIETLLVICGPMFVMEDILDWPQFLSKLVQDADKARANPGKRIFDLLSSQDSAFIRENSGRSFLSDSNKSKIIESLNKLLEHKDFYQEQDYSCIDISDRVVQLLACNREALSRAELQKLNRLLIEATYPNEIAESRKRFITKNPSFARIQRVWRTTQKFWKQIEEEDIPSIIQSDHKRVEIEVSNKGVLTQKLGYYHSYDAEINGCRITLVWDSDSKTLLTAENLFARIDGGAEKFCEFCYQHREIKLYEPGGYGQKRNEIATAIVEKEPEPHPIFYAPIIPLLSQPASFMMLVPAADALKVMETISHRYELEMSKVRNRLPLFLGSVFFDSRQPLFGALDAGRRMLSTQFHSKTCKVECSCNHSGEHRNLLPDHLKEESPNGESSEPIKHFNEWQELHLTTENNESLCWRASTVMGDGVTLDDWYPYVHVLKDQHNQAPIGRKQFAHPKINSQQWVHVSDIRVNDEVRYIPSQFTWLYLDTSARRFEAINDERMYPLEELESITSLWERLKKLAEKKRNSLTQTQLQAVVSLLAAKRISWGSNSAPFKQLVETTLLKEGLEGVSLDDVTSGRLENMFELYHHILKEKISKTNS